MKLTKKLFKITLILSVLIYFDDPVPPEALSILDLLI